ncbi:hypothetical protein [Rhizobium phaseoli]|jgi:bifunctional non-homologous end joining protein LigD|uniref:ATP dependent DNA ligase n=1 Tax=Rhizobium phaseoli TaxID=396 RepID=UPI0032B1AA92
MDAGRRWKADHRQACRRLQNAVLVDPRLVAETDYRAWTHDRELRHTSYKRLRDTDNPAVCEAE